MTLTIETADPRSDAAQTLLIASQAFMASQFPAEANHVLDTDALCGPTVHFFLASSDNKALGCAALAHKGSYGEVKSMFVSPEARGKGVGQALLLHLDHMAKDQGLGALYLETGTTLHPARRLYEAHGYNPCDPFGDYAADPLSVFYCKTL